MAGCRGRQNPPTTSRSSKAADGARPSNAPRKPSERRCSMQWRSLNIPFADYIQPGEHFVRKFEFGGPEVLVEVIERRGARNQEDVGRAVKQPGECNLHRRRA